MTLFSLSVRVSFIASDGQGGSPSLFHIARCRSRSHRKLVDGSALAIQRLRDADFAREKVDFKVAADGRQIGGRLLRGGVRERLNYVHRAYRTDERDREGRERDGWMFIGSTFTPTLT